MASSSKVQLSSPRATSKRKLKTVDPEPESEEKWGDDDEPSSDSDEEEDGEGGDGGGDAFSGGGSEESDLNVDAPRVAQWVDEDELEQPETASGGASYRKMADVEDIVRVMYVSPKFGWFIVCFVLCRKPYKTVRQ